MTLLMEYLVADTDLVPRERVADFEHPQEINALPIVVPSSILPTSTLQHRSFGLPNAKTYASLVEE